MLARFKVFESFLCVFMSVFRFSYAKNKLMGKSTVAGDLFQYGGLADSKVCGPLHNCCCQREFETPRFELIFAKTKTKNTDKSYGQKR